MSNIDLILVLNLKPFFLKNEFISVLSFGIIFCMYSPSGRLIHDNLKSLFINRFLVTSFFGVWMTIHFREFRQECVFKTQSICSYWEKATECHILACPFYSHKTEPRRRKALEKQLRDKVTFDSKDFDNVGNTVQDVIKRTKDENIISNRPGWCWRWRWKHGRTFSRPRDPRALRRKPYGL